MQTRPGVTSVTPLASSAVVVETRLEVLCRVDVETEPRFFPGKVTSIDRTTDPVTYHILYDAGDSEPLDLTKEEYRILPAEVSTVPEGKSPFWLENLRYRWQQELSGVPPEEANDIIETLSRSLADGSRNTYSSTQNQFIRFCTQHSLSAIPANTVTVLRFLNSVDKRGTVQATSLQSYLSGINKMHVEAGFDPPALGTDVVDFKKGMGRKQKESGDFRESEDRLRVYLPAEVALLVRDRALELLDAVSSLPRFSSKKAKALCTDFRALVYTFFIYTLFARSDTGTKLAFDDVLLQQEGLHVTLRNLKGKKHTKYIKPLLFPPGAVQGLETLVANWLALKKRMKFTSGENLWRFRWESTRQGWPSSLGDDWLQHALGLVGHPDPPPGCKWTSHSCRKGATTSASAIGVVDTVYCYVGDWSVKSTTRLDYIDPTARPSPAMFEIFGWLHPSSGFPTSSLL